MYATARAFVRSLALRVPPLRRLYDTVSALRGQNAQLIDTVDRLRASNATMGAQLIEQSTALAAAATATPPAAASADNGIASALQSERDRAREHAAQARDQIATFAQAAAQMGAKLSLANAALESVTEEFAASRAHTDEIQTQNSRLVELLALSESRLRQEVERAAAELGEAQRQMRALGNDLSVANARILELEDAIKSAYEAVSNAHQERDSARAELDATNLQLRVTSAENMARLLGKLSFVEYSLGAPKRESQNSSGASESGAALYLDLLEASLTGMLEEDGSQSPWTAPEFSAENRLLGRDWPERALTMIGVVRMRNLRRIVETVIADKIPGDFIETGVWRGGACIYMSGILAAHGDAERQVWVADSFEGLPPPSPDLYPEDAGDVHSTYGELAISEREVRDNFQRYGLLTDRVKFLKGWFKDTLAGAPIEEIALLRLDGDMYESTIQALDALYDKVTAGGFIIVDDYGLAGCRKAVEEFRENRGISDALVDVDGAAVFWRKASGTATGIVKMSDKRRTEQPN